MKMNNLNAVELNPKKGSKIGQKWSEQKLIQGVSQQIAKGGIFLEKTNNLESDYKNISILRQ